MMFRNHNKKYSETRKGTTVNTMAALMMANQYITKLY